MNKARDVGAAVCVLAGAAGCHGAMVYNEQARTIIVSTAADGMVLTSSAPDFAYFADTLALSTTFPTPTGGTGVNTAEAGIDCHLDPNRIRLIGRILGAGGTGVFDGGVVGPVNGHAAVVLRVDVTLGQTELVSVASLPRPNVNPEDKFKVKIRRTGGGGGIVFQIDETSPPTSVDTLLTLVPGGYSIEYEAEITVIDGEASSDTGFMLLARSADIDADGALNTGDLVRLLGRFGRTGVGTWDDASVADLNGDGAVDTADLSQFLGALGSAR